MFPDVRRRKMQLLWSGNAYGVGGGPKSSWFSKPKEVEGEACEDVIFKRTYLKVPEVVR
jgi:hypothetical protein